MKNLVGILGWLGVALVGAAVVMSLTRPEWQPWPRYLALAGLVVTLAYAYTQRRELFRSFGSRNVRYGSMAFAGVLLLMLLLVAVNYLGVRHNKIWDFTSSKQFSLSEQTLKILTDLKKPVVVHAFFDSSPQSASSKKDLEDKLGLYAYGSTQFSVIYVDAIKDAVLSNQYDVHALPTTVFEYDGRSERATGQTEQDFTNAIKKLLDGTVKKVYFTAAHGEHDFEESNQRGGFAAAASALKDDNFQSARVVIPQEGKIPDDATVVIIAGPKTDYTVPEIDALKKYMGKGGKVLLMIDPPDKADTPPLANLIAFAKEWGIEVGNNLVLDVSGMGQQIGAGPTIPIAMPAKPLHPIAESAQLAAVFALARSVTPIDGGTNGRIAQRVLETQKASWGESNLADLMAKPPKEPKFEADKGDKPGPVSIVAAVSTAAPDAPAPASPDLPKPEARLVVAGDSDFASNALLGQQGNRDWFQNMVTWLAQQENLIAIRAKDPGNRPLNLTEDQNTRIWWLCLVVVPLLLFGNGFWVWWKRRG